MQTHSSDHGAPAGKTKEEIQLWLTEFLAEVLELRAAQLDVYTSFERYGLDSSMAVSVTESLGSWLKRDLSPTLLYSYQTIDALAGHLAAPPQEEAERALLGSATR